MKRKMILVLALVLAFGMLLYKGAGKRALINVLVSNGYEKCADGVYRMREIQEAEGRHLIVIDRYFDVKKNYGESHITTLYMRIDGKNEKESSVESIAYWDYAKREFLSLDGKIG